jgi:hypothetical protein
MNEKIWNILKLAPLLFRILEGMSLLCPWTIVNECGMKPKYPRENHVAESNSPCKNMCVFIYFSKNTCAQDLGLSTIKNLGFRCGIVGLIYMY